MDLYVATDDGGTQRDGETTVEWPLPREQHEGHESEGTVEPGALVEVPVRLLTARALLGHLDARIFHAEPLDDGGSTTRIEESADSTGIVHVDRARLVAAAHWDGFAAASFAIDCTEHVLGPAEGVALPDGTPLGEVLKQVRRWLESAEDDTGALHKVRDLALAWRLRRQGKRIGDAAFDAFMEATGADVEALDDPVWTAVASARDAALAAVEAVQHAFVPHLAAAEAGGYELAERHVTTRPASHEHAPASWVPYWTATDDAAERARQAAAAGGENADAELDWQGARLAEVLAGA